MKNSLFLVISQRLAQLLSHPMISDEEPITLQEYLEQEAQWEQEAIAAFPGKFDECTYVKGYIRQPLYVCRSCLQDSKGGVAAICYSCSLACHASCDLIELYAKRHFRCDCGNESFASKFILF